MLNDILGVVAYLPVLAIHTLHVAMGEKDITDTMRSGNNRLFATMRAD